MAVDRIMDLAATRSNPLESQGAGVSALARRHGRFAIDAAHPGFCAVRRKALSARAPNF
jgi:hypothetical protein